MNFEALRSAGFTRPLADLPLPVSLKILVLAPHPDDFDAIGVTLKRLFDNGNPIHAAVARSGSGIEDAYCPGYTLAQKADLRQEEQRRSLRFFGLSDERVSFLSLVNDAEDQLVETPENEAVILSLMRQETPDIVFLPHGNDTNSAHRAMYSLFRKAALQLGRPLAAFLNRDPKTVRMRIDVYTPFGQAEAEWKARLLRFHDSQHQRNLRSRGRGFDERILEVNRGLARELSLAQEFAEAFEVETLEKKRIAFAAEIG